MERKNIPEELKYIFGNVNTWLNFAETKNAALIAFDIALLAALMNNGDIYENKQILCYFLVGGVITSLIISFFSFLPILSKTKNINLKTEDNDNVLYFKHIVKYKPKQYLERVYNYCDIKFEGDFSTLELNYAEEIIENSRIAFRKYKYFSYNLKFNIIILCFIMCIIVID